jgi:hypothetical protein
MLQFVNRLREGASFLGVLPAKLGKLWSRDYHDSRIILEQQGEIGRASCRERV